MDMNKIYNMDCLEGMKKLPNDSIDLTVTSPPYDKLRKYKGFSWDFKLANKICSEYALICIEDLNVKGMIRNHKLAKSIASVSWAKFFEMLEYKAIWYGNEIRRVPTMYPSSQTCSFCGCRNPLVKNLCIRIWECPKCHTVHDRDTNASINILKKELQRRRYKDL